MSNFTSLFNGFFSKTGYSNLLKKFPSLATPRRGADLVEQQRPCLHTRFHFFSGTDLVLCRGSSISISKLSVRSTGYGETVVAASSASVYRGTLPASVPIGTSKNLGDVFGSLV